ncbi:serine hydrolase-domain-containing protein [Polychytrium aggregatum]|uniref:serine hydrolase-domain-containing protein n=1 Tax=Polychytrium aggregatum TaxID=110093 RepID=UPI0022FEDE6B|nr:serine hydrolase-domain-containing protein [Polychytrium aggregatum]KAI9202461.1 serine hydrolase-domain-containing protein [Polychytrium aggregatum]
MSKFTFWKRPDGQPESPSEPLEYYTRASGRSSLSRRSRTPAAPPGSLRRKRRFLCLHGRGTSADFMDFQLGSLKSISRDDMEFHFINGPNQTEPFDDPFIIENFASHGFYSWTDPSENAQVAVYEVIKKASLLAPLDGIIGFSQGAALATYMTALSEKGDLPKLWNMVVLLCGVDPPQEWFANGILPTGKILTPSVHVHGLADPYLSRSKLLADMYERPVVLSHDQGHQVPFKLPFNQSMKEAIIQAIPSARP